MGKIFCLMGKSSSGKDTIFKLLKENNINNLKNIITYTTRPIRDNEKDGVAYFFIEKKDLYKLDDDNKIIEYREYDTIHGKWYYATIADNQIDIENNNYLIINTLEAYIQIRNYYGAKNVIPIYIELEDGIRLERALKREQEQYDGRYEELCRRFLADNKDFSEKLLSLAGIENRFNNVSSTETTELINKFILETLRN